MTYFYYPNFFSKFCIQPSIKSIKELMVSNFYLHKVFNLFFVFMFKFVSFYNGILGELFFLFNLPCLHPCMKMYDKQVVHPCLKNIMCNTFATKSPIGFQFYYKELCKCIAQIHILKSSKTKSLKKML
jgi:hypothetical protein